MVAVLLSGAKQFLVKEGDVIQVEKVDTPVDTTHHFDRVLLKSKEGENAEIGTPFLSTTISGKVLRHGRGEKIRIFKMKAKKNYRRTQGHRQWFSEIEIQKI